MLLKHIIYLQEQDIYMGQCIHKLLMNNKNMVLAIVLSIAVTSAIIPSVTAVQAQSAFMPYGSVGNEDQPLVFYKGFYYLNVIPGGSNGMFMKLVDFDKDYSIDQAIERFGIQEDTTHFNVQPSVFSQTELVYQLDEDNQFQMIGIVQ